jgi:pimeloyl-ACP methyl ester carboxylesterase
MSPSQTLVLVPGLVCDEAVWQAQIASLAAHRRVQVADHGLSSSLGEMADRILAAAPAHFALAGHSMGGRVALEVYARAPERVERLALMDTGFEGLPPGSAGETEKQGRFRLRDLAHREGMLAMGKDWAQGMVHPSRLQDTNLMAKIHQMIAQAPVAKFEAQIEALLNRPDRTALLAAITVPTLVLCGQQDGWSPLARHQAMAQRIHGSVLVDIPLCGHMSTLERPGEVNQELLAWLARTA